MEHNLGRPVSIGEVFIKTHTRPDGSYVDLKAKQICEAYERNIQEKMAIVEVDPTETSDGTSRPIELTQAQKNEIFLQSSVPDERGRLYGLGSLSRVQSTGRSSGVQTHSPEYVMLQEQNALIKAQNAQMMEKCEKIEELTEKTRRRSRAWRCSSDISNGRIPHSPPLCGITIAQGNHRRLRPPPIFAIRFPISATGQLDFFYVFKNFQ
ncbi:hypothetical protein BSL78_25372 [Apostichopus japonicus]|uniref:Uncharacterized protein n=1 Tax=Stichopus japonicus TaxID=307972 RepID=A0A2G8JPU1_STIJA|nr:hypothetical protein BSL78_25372 [Apostichopus japonicus]